MGDESLERCRELYSPLGFHATFWQGFRLTLMMVRADNNVCLRGTHDNPRVRSVYTLSEELVVSDRGKRIRYMLVCTATASDSTVIQLSAEPT